MYSMSAHKTSRRFPFLRYYKGSPRLKQQRMTTFLGSWVHRMTALNSYRYYLVFTLRGNLSNRIRFSTYMHPSQVFVINAALRLTDKNYVESL